MPGPIPSNSFPNSVEKDSPEQQRDRIFDIVRHGSLEELQELIDQNYYFDFLGKDANYPIHVAIISERPAVASLLIDAGANVHRQGAWGRTPLILAADEEFGDLVVKLLERGADINAQDVRGFTALHWAITGKYFDMVKLLVENGAAVDLPNDEGITPLSLAATRGYGKILALLKKHRKNRKTNK